MHGRRMVARAVAWLVLLGWLWPVPVQALEPSPGWPPVYQRMQESLAQMKGMKGFSARLEVVQTLHRFVETEVEAHHDPMVTMFWVYLDMVAATPSPAACKDVREEIHFAALSPTREMEGLPTSAAWALDLLGVLCR